MREAKILLFLGIWVTILPFLGFPYSLKNVLFSVSGLGLICLSYVIYRKLKGGDTVREKTFNSFSENKDFDENEHRTGGEN